MTNESFATPRQITDRIDPAMAALMTERRVLSVALYKLKLLFGPLLMGSYPEGTDFYLHSASRDVATFEKHAALLKEPVMLTIGDNISFYIPATITAPNNILPNSMIRDQWSPFFNRNLSTLTPAAELVFSSGSRAEMEYGLDVQLGDDLLKAQEKLDKIADITGITFPLSANGKIYRANHEPTPIPPA